MLQAASNVTAITYPFHKLRERLYRPERFTRLRVVELGGRAWIWGDDLQDILVIDDLGAAVTTLPTSLWREVTFDVGGGRYDDRFVLTLEGAYALTRRYRSLSARRLLAWLTERSIMGFEREGFEERAASR